VSSASMPELNAQPITLRS